MVVIATIGSAAVGGTWGWLLGKTDGTVRRPFRTFAALILATALVVTEVLVFAGWKQVFAFGVAAFVTLLLHLGWRRGLRRPLIHQD